MRLVLAAVLAVAVVGGVMFASSIPDQGAVAAANKKYHFTQTITSSPSPGVGHEGHQLAMILSPNQGTIYDGSLTYTASAPVQIVVLHEMDAADAKGQPTWTIDQETIYGWTIVRPDTSSGSFEYTGAALALHTGGEEFTATVSVDGWIRGQPTDIILQNPVREETKPSVALARSSVPATIPLHAGTYDDGNVLYILTDASDQTWASDMGQRQGWNVETAPPLAAAPDDAVGTMYVFTNGPTGDGLYGYQPEVFSATPDRENYAALNRVVEITWKPGQNQKVLGFDTDIKDAIEAGRLLVNDTGIIANAPQIVWPGGQMVVRESVEFTDGMEYGGGQITEIDQEGMTVTFVAHRGWGPDGKTIYYIVTDATPSDPAKTMGVVDSQVISSLVTSSAAVDIFQFSNGLEGAGPLGFQPGIAAAAPGDESYSPMWRIYLTEWNDPSQAKLLETRADIDYYKSADMLTTSLARPMNSDHIVNCPFVDPFQ